MITNAMSMMASYSAVQLQLGTEFGWQDSQ